MSAYSRRTGRTLAGFVAFVVAAAVIVIALGDLIEAAS